MTNNDKRNIYNNIQNLYNMDFKSWQEVLAMMYNLVADTSQKFEAFEQKFDLMLGSEVTKAIKELYENGSLTQIINSEVFKNLNSKIDYLKEHIEKTRKEISEQLNNIAKIPIKLTGQLDGKIVLNKSTIYVIENNLTLNDGCIVDGRGATIKFDGIININNNVEIYNVNFKTVSQIERQENIPITQKTITLNIENSKGFILKNCKGNGIEVNLNNATDFIIENNSFTGGYSVVGVIQGFNNCKNGIVRNNKINGCYTNGIGFHTCNNIIIELNECYKNGHSGIYTPYCTNLIIKENKCYNHKIYDGIDANFSADNMKFSDNFNSTIENNVCFNNGATGIYVSGSGITIKENQLYNNGTNGLRIAKWNNSDVSRASNIKVIFNIIYNNNIKNNLQTSSLNHNALFDGIDNSYIKDNIVYIDDVNIITLEYNMYLNGNNNIIQLNNMYDSRLLNKDNITLNIVGNFNKTLKNITSYNDKDFLQIKGINIQNNEVSDILLNINNNVRCNGQGDFTVLRSLELPFYVNGINSFQGVNNNSICISKQNNGSGEPTYFLTLKESDGNYYIPFTKH